MKQLSNFSVETLHCSLAEEVQVDSRIQRAGEKSKYFSFSEILTVKKKKKINTLCSNFIIFPLMCYINSE